MPIVVVHGVNIRKEEPGYKARIALTSSLISRHFTGAIAAGKTLKDSTPEFAYWGDLAARFAWEMASLPTGRIDSLGGQVESNLRPVLGTISDSIGGLEAAEQNPLLTLARLSLPQAIAVLSELLIQTTTDDDAEHIAAFILAAQAYAEANPHPSWVSGLATDAQFLSLLPRTIFGAARSGQIQSLGGGGSIGTALSFAAATLQQALSAAANAAFARTGDFACTKLLAWQRRPLNAILGRFFGDVFVYLDARGDGSEPGPIPLRLMGILRAAAARASGEPLIVIGHSLGGVICFDLLSTFCPDVIVDLFVTVGSQVSHFEELKRFKASDPALPSAARPRAPTPSNITHWINVFDEVDIFAYTCGGVFDRVVDFHYDTRTYTIAAHSAYLEQHRFYSRLRERIDQLP